MLYRPSVDLLFHSVADSVGGKAVGIILTGMGDDGSRGLAAMQAAGARTITESEETAVIYGMPRAARVWADEVVALHHIPAALLRILSGAPQEGLH
jgi:two-component system chemotaxis response regulator CheB